MVKLLGLGPEYNDWEPNSHREVSISLCYNTTLNWTEALIFILKWTTPLNPSTG